MRHRVVALASLLMGLMFVGGAQDSLVSSIAEARKPRVKRKYMIQVLVQTPRRFSVPGVQIYINDLLMGATDRFGIYIGFFNGHERERLSIKIKGMGLKMSKARRFRLQTRTTNGRVIAEPVKARFFLRGSKLVGKLHRFPIRVFALSPDRVGIAGSKVYIDGKYVGTTNKYGVYVGSFKGRPGEVIQVKVVGRGKDNEATLPARLRLKKRGKRPIPVKFHAYIRP